jgi:hypothetical protein
MSKPTIKSNGGTTIGDAGFAEGVSRSSKNAAGSKVQSQYAVSEMKDGESTVRPIQTGQTDVHYDEASSRPVIPVSQNTQVSQSLRVNAGPM